MNLYKITTVNHNTMYYLGDNYSDVEKKREGLPKILKIKLIQSNIE